MDRRILDILVCPLCKGPLKLHKHQSNQPNDGAEAELVCSADKLAFPVRDGIPVMLIDSARSLDPA